jgi:hypothetical protein
MFSFSDVTPIDVASSYTGYDLHPLSFDLLAWQERKDCRDEEGWPSGRGYAELRRAITKLAKAIRGDRKLLLSKAETCRALGIDGKTTLERLIADRHIRVVKAPHGLRVPRSEVLRLEQEGIPAPSTPPRRAPPRASPRAGDVGDAIRAIKIT